MIVLRYLQHQFRNKGREYSSNRWEEDLVLDSKIITMDNHLVLHNSNNEISANSLHTMMKHLICNLQKMSRFHLMKRNVDQQQPAPEDSIKLAWERLKRKFWIMNYCI